jgi:esterase/lipase
MADQVPTRPDRRLGQTYRFTDPNMDLFFIAALGWGPTGGLDVGQVFHIASQIADGDADSWVSAFKAYGEEMNALADLWKARGWTRAAGETHLKAAISYRSAWQFAPVGDVFQSIYADERKAFAAAMSGLALPATFFSVPYKGKSLPGIFLQNAKKDAPVILVIGGSDTGFEDLFFTVGRDLFERGYSVALADLPGQGNMAADGLTWEVEAERPIGVLVDALVEKFQAVPGRIALLGLSLGGYFVTRAAGHEKRFGAVIASTPFPRPGEMFSASVRAARTAGEQPSSAALRNHQILAWKAGAKNAEEMVALTHAMIADPSIVTVPFLSIAGAGDSPIFRSQAEAWHAAIPSRQKNFVLLDAASGADGHCQVNNRRRLGQETAGWLGEIMR